MSTIQEFLCFAVDVFYFMVIIRRFTEPVLDWTRRVMPRTGALDLSPLVVLLFLQIVVQRMILGC